MKNDLSRALDKVCDNIKDPVDRMQYRLSIRHVFDLGWQAAQAEARDAALEEAACIVESSAKFGSPEWHASNIRALKQEKNNGE